MSRSLVDRLARALLYEGYILYPYRPSVKNRQRWTFGGIYPQSWSDVRGGTDAAVMQTQCLVAGGADTAVRVSVRFLHLVERTVGELPRPLAEWPGDDVEFRPVESLQVGDQHYQSWQEAVEREVDLGDLDLGGLLAGPNQRTFAFPSRHDIEPLRSPAGQDLSPSPGTPGEGRGGGLPFSWPHTGSSSPAGHIVGVLDRRQREIEGTVDLSCRQVGEGLLELTVRVLNRTPLADAAEASRDDALMRCLVSTHTILEVRDGEFVSLLETPEPWSAQAAACRNVGTWPVLVGEAPRRNTMLSSPIILYDYPQIAPESPGDLFDATEIDEILTLRIMTLTDDEKRVAAGTDERVRDLLSRTASLARGQLMGLHGAVRGLRPVAREQTHG